MDIRRKIVEAHAEARQVIDQTPVAPGQRKWTRGGAAASPAASEADTVEVSLGRSINAEIGSARREKIEQLKALIERGQYRPDAKAVAAAVADYIDDEVWYERLRSSGGKDAV